MTYQGLPQATAPSSVGSEVDESRPQDPPPRRRRGRRAITMVLIMILTLLAAGHLAVGWYFSSRIGADVLGVQKRVDIRPLEVVSLDRDTITVRVAEGEPSDHWMFQQLSGPGIAGLEWEGGYARSVQLPRVHGAEVSRDYTMITGSRPTVGQRIGKDSFAWPWTTAIAPYQTVQYGELHGEPLTGWFRAPDKGTDAAPTKTWAVLVHGKGADSAEHAHTMEVLSGLGVPSLSLQYRGDPGQPAADNNRHAFGQTEWADLAQGVAYAQSQGAEDVILVGTSMGGAIVAAYLERTPDAPVRAVMFDCPALDLGATIAWAARSVPLPGGVVPPRSIFAVAKLFATMRYGVDWSAVNYLDDTSWVRVPTLVFHGTRDATVPVTISRRLDQASPLVTLIENPQADHAQSWNLEPESYDAAQREFLGRVLATSDR